ncbi:two-component system, chemotaxis family, response regulator CheY [Amphibacillus marinus]|uniref:Two-component system, chemotaxis family, response regulator CheY n=1 Tax=Amphibacillus marinus TaxID=872970 RepID=A0A1H8II85_9BACI|nr:response regulator [Amphibacillus marinus]SEN68224.1 two-component system, chemotaxis family, response regulator CheY [Amphibacillus marinus]
MYSVLIVDDSSFMRAWLKRLITNQTYSIAAEASNGYEAILNYRKTKPDLVLLDNHLPDITGVEVLKRIMSIDANAKVIICSAMGTDFLVKECLVHGAKDFIRKPNFEHLLNKMDNIMLDKSNPID